VPSRHLLRNLVLFQPSFDSPNRFYTLYYDESNNHRKFYINEEENNYNIDNDPQRKQSAPINFLIAGVAYKGNICPADALELIKSLKLQKSAKELKFNQVASNNFDSVLKSPEINSILKWLLDNDLYIHYFNLNMEYWAFIDIIDDCVRHCYENERLTFQSDFHFRDYLDFHKDALYRIIRADRAAFLGMVKNLNYPCIEGREQEFIKSLHTFTIDFITNQFVQGPVTVESSDIDPFLSLAELFSLCQDIPDMTMTMEWEKGILVDGFSVFYYNRMVSFPNSVHFFDEESKIEKKIASLNRNAKQSNIQYKFVKSANTPMTQVADVVAGLFAKYFDFIVRHSNAELANFKARFNVSQLETMSLLKALIEKTDVECPQLLFYVISPTEHKKHQLFLFPEVSYRGLKL